jgi:hypothetical protein
MIKRIVLIGLALLFVTQAGYAEEKELGITFDLTYLSQWLSKGAPAYGSHGALFKSIDIDLWGTGFGVEVIHRNSISSGYVDKERIDYRPYIKGVLFRESPYEMTYNIGSEYESYYGLSRTKSNTTWETVGGFSWPKLLPKGFVPMYVVHYETPATSEGKYNYIAGWVHRFILNYDMKIENLPSPLRFSSEVAYTDGLGGASSDWSYAVFGLSTTFKISKNLTFAPGIYQQVTMDKSVCPRDDVTYCIISTKYKF